MTLRLRHLAVILLAAILLPGAIPCADADDSAELRRPPRGSLARQKLLKLKLQRIAGGPLETALRHNRQEWEGLTPDQRQAYRESFLAFLKKSPEKQDELLKRYEKLFSMSAERREAYRRRAEWLSVVVQSFSETEREELRRMTPDQRARRILDRKQELIREGKLEPPEGASQPATADEPASTTVPADEPDTEPTSAPALAP